MLLALDIGNTEISLGLFEGEDLERSWRVTTRPDRTPDEWAVLLRALFAEGGLDITEVTGTVMCSVVPPATDAMAEALLTAMRAHPLGRDAAIIGKAVDDERRFVQMQSSFGGARIVDWLAGEQLPRIC